MGDNIKLAHIAKTLMGRVQKNFPAVKYKGMEQNEWRKFDPNLVDS
jgi:hypothetical protein